MGLYPSIYVNLKELVVIRPFKEFHPFGMICPSYGLCVDRLTLYALRDFHPSGMIHSSNGLYLFLVHFLWTSNITRLG